MSTPSDEDLGADRPIKQRGQDLLGRRRFAEEIAKGIVGRKGKESYVIGLYGTWGSGKSSVMYMILEAFDDEREADRPIVVSFNPWQYTDAETLAQTFFSEIAEKLEGPTPDAKAKERAQKWKQLGSHLKVGGDALAKLATVAGLAGVPLMDIAKAAAGGLTQAGAATDAAKDYLEGQKVRSLSQIKAELRELMTELEKPVLVVIDDIDRLSANEMALVFQLVKANGDFPNLVYLLLFQRDLVEASLNDVAPNKSGADYLEKIVQRGINLPAIGEESLFKMLLLDLERILGKEEVGRFTWPGYTEDLGTLAGVFTPHFRTYLMPYFETVRDIRRFANTVDFQGGMLMQDGALQAHTGDFITMEILRVFEPSVYEGIVQAKQVFTSNPNGLASNRLDEWFKKYVLDVVSKARQKERVEQILREHFPNLTWIFAQQKPVGEAPGDKDRVSLRVCHPDTFDRYFRLCLPENEFSEAEYRATCALLYDPEALTEKLSELNHRNVLDDLLIRWLYRKDTFDDDSRKRHTAVIAVCDLADKLPVPKAGDLRLAFRFVIDFLSSQWAHGGTANFLVQAAGQMKGLYLVCEHICAMKIEGAGHDIRFGYSDADVQLLASLWRNRLHEAARTGQLDVHSKRVILVACWYILEDEDKAPPKEWLGRHLEPDANLFAFLRLLRSLYEPDRDTIEDFARYFFTSPLYSVLHDRMVQSVQDGLLEDEKKLVHETVSFHQSIEEAQRARP